MLDMQQELWRNEEFILNRCGETSWMYCQDGRQAGTDRV